MKPIEMGSLEVCVVKFQKMAISALAVVALAGVTLTLTLNSNAQLADPQPGQGPGAGPRGGIQGGPPGAPGQFPGGPPPGQPGQFQRQGGFGGGGGTAMDSDNSFLYIVQGNMLFKVAKNDLKILGSTPLQQMPAREFGGRGDVVRPPQGGPPPPETAK